ncbi:hypothetical protein ACFXHA_41265 [Nocardia sp. NPDC059240]|uniref:hypothetical protein n=1 Tax=Nocardia sp. NPDC059240 TaxID=3346786 RepID=UPI003695DEB4
MAAEAAALKRQHWREYGKDFGSAVLLAFLLSLVLWEFWLVAMMLTPTEPPSTPLHRIVQAPIILPLPPTMQPVSPSPNAIPSLPPRPR